MLSAQRCCKNQLDSRMLKLTHVPAEEMWHDTQLHETWRFIKAMILRKNLMKKTMKSYI